MFIAITAWAMAGCSAAKMAELRPAPKSPLVDQFKLTAWSGPQPSDRTMQFLRVYDLAEELKGDPKKLLEKTQAVIEREPSPDKIYTIAELSFLQAKRVETSDPKLALDFYGASALRAFQYLFDEQFRGRRNPYDPHFRGACDLYNGALEECLRLVAKDKSGLAPGKCYAIHTAGGDWDITCAIRSAGWRPEDFGRFEFVSDYEIKGLKNHYQAYGMGVPLIAVRQTFAGEPIAARYYPAGLSFPVTAFLRPLREAAAEGPSAQHKRAVLELFDPLTIDDIPINGVHVPLESDLTTPLAYFLSNPAMESFDMATAGLLRPDKLLANRVNGTRPIMGLYMIQPYETGKIPVLMVHGLWSSPMTWMAMFNDLRSCPQIRDRYQFWFYLYPTAQPFWLTAAQLRRDLAEIREALDPHRREPALDQMVLIGHSMGGLVSRLQTLPSGNEYWSLVSGKPFEQVQASPEVRERLATWFFFEPNPSIRRVVTLGTPHRGSSFSSQTAQWLANKLIRLPQMLMQSQETLFRENKDFFPETSLLRIPTSVDSLVPSNPIFATMISSPRPPCVKYHNIIGVVPQDGWLRSVAGNSDGVVDYDSAHMDDTASELIVPADHTTVHSHPLAVLEVRRILLECLAENPPVPDGDAFVARDSLPSWPNDPTRWPTNHPLWPTDHELTQQP